MLGQEDYYYLAHLPVLLHHSQSLVFVQCVFAQMERIPSAGTLLVGMETVECKCTCWVLVMCWRELAQSSVGDVVRGASALSLWDSASRVWGGHAACVVMDGEQTVGGRSTMEWKPTE